MIGVVEALKAVAIALGSGAPGLTDARAVVECIIAVHTSTNTIDGISMRGTKIRRRYDA